MLTQFKLEVPIAGGRFREHRRERGRRHRLDPRGCVSRPAEVGLDSPDPIFEPGQAVTLDAPGHRDVVRHAHAIVGVVAGRGVAPAARYYRSTRPIPLPAFWPTLCVYCSAYAMQSPMPFQSSTARGGVEDGGIYF